MIEGSVTIRISKPRRAARAGALHEHLTEYEHVDDYVKKLFLERTTAQTFF